MHIRKAEPAEFARVADILTDAYAPSGITPGTDYWGVLRDVAGRSATAEVWVAVRAGDVVGTVTWAPLGSPQRDIAADAEAEFRMLAVDPAAQRSGVGLALARQMIDRARADGFSAVVLSSSEWMTPAHRMYEALGFQRAPQRDWAPRPGINLRTYVLGL